MIERKHPRNNVTEAAHEKVKICSTDTFYKDKQYGFHINNCQPIAYIDRPFHCFITPNITVKLNLILESYI